MICHSRHFRLVALIAADSKNCHVEWFILSYIFSASLEVIIYCSIFKTFKLLSKAIIIITARMSVFQMGTEILGSKIFDLKIISSS